MSKTLISTIIIIEALYYSIGFFVGGWITVSSGTIMCDIGVDKVTCHGSEIQCDIIGCRQVPYFATFNHISAQIIMPLCVLVVVSVCKLLATMLPDYSRAAIIALCVVTIPTNIMLIILATLVNPVPGLERNIVGTSEFHVNISGYLYIMILFVTINVSVLVTAVAHETKKLYKKWRSQKDEVVSV